MAIGPGIYDAVTTKVRTETEALAVMVVVIEGKLGTGFSVQAPLAVALALPDMLEEIARQIRIGGIGVELNNPPPEHQRGDL